MQTVTRRSTYRQTGLEEGNMARKVFFGFKNDERAMEVASRPLAGQQTVVIQAPAYLQEV